MFRLKQQDAKLKTVNSRPEKHGEDPVPASDIFFVIVTSNSMLDDINKDLRQIMFKKAPKEDEDLADAAMGDEFLRDIRCALMPETYALIYQCAGYKLHISQGISGKEDINLIGCQLDKFKITPKQGGTVEIEFRVVGHPTAEETGQLCFLQQRQVDITLTPPSAEEQAQMKIDEIKDAVNDDTDDELEEAS